MTTTTCQLLRVPSPSIALFQSGLVKLQIPLRNWRQIAEKLGSLQITESFREHFCLTEDPLTSFHVTVSAGDVWIVEHSLRGRLSNADGMVVRMIRIALNELYQLINSTKDIYQRKRKSDDSDLILSSSSSSSTESMSISSASSSSANENDGGD